jgi:hypothetical protein
VKITLEHKLNDDVIDVFYPLYAAAFDPIRTRAAARHMLTAEEFADEMVDERIDKYVVWDDNGAPVAMSTLATDLAAVPWVSADYYRSRHPEAAARGALYYLGYTVVDPENAGKGAFLLMMATLHQRCADDRAVCGLDISAHNEAHTIGRRLATLAAAEGVVVQRVDTQRYYEVSFDRTPFAGIGA